jgi:hypothetical protein
LTDIDKHSSLQLYGIIYERKKFYDTPMSAAVIYVAWSNSQTKTNNGWDTITQKTWSHSYKTFSSLFVIHILA